jgi:hypothetical protein
MKSFAAWLFIALTIASSPCEAGLVYVTLGNSGTLATASLTNTFTTTTNACPAGSLIILWANYESTSDAPSSVTDSAGNTYQTPIDNIAGSGIGIGIVYAKNTSANLPVGGTITATFAGSVTSRVGASCVTGASQTAPLVPSIKDE